MPGRVFLSIQRRFRRSSPWPLPYGRGSDGGRGSDRRGFLLLEIVVSMALLLLGLMFIGGQVTKTEMAAREDEQMTRVLMLAESKLAELDTGLVNLEEEADAETEGDFTARFPDFGWRIRAEETATAGLWRMTLEILHAPREDPEQEFDFDHAAVLHSVYTMRAEPAKVDLQADFGMDEESITQLTDALPIKDFDPLQFDPLLLARLDTEELLEVLSKFPNLLEALGIDTNSALPPELQQLLNAAETELSGRDAGGNQGSGPGEQAAPPTKVPARGKPEAGGSPAAGPGKDKPPVTPDAGERPGSSGGGRGRSPGGGKPADVKRPGGKP